MSSKEPVRNCSACGLPPRENRKLQRCSRCKSTWYHDVHCQKQHFPQHKKICHLITTSLDKANSSPHVAVQNENSLVGQEKRKVAVERRVGRGNCLVAKSFIRKGERIRDPKKEFWEPLVPPVLHVDSRSNRCALCFQNLGYKFFRYDDVKPRPEYLLLFCSPKCRLAGKSKGMMCEEVAISRLFEQGGPPKVFSTAILLFRILLASNGPKSQSIKDQLDKLQHTIDNTAGADTSTSEYHTQAVITTTVAMIQASTEYRIVLPPLEQMTAMVQRIKLNGFSICDGEFVSMGVGLYGTPSFMNHSCEPNAVQTFLYGHCEPPTLFVTAYYDIHPENEVCISYVDTTSPRHMRQERLYKDYFFSCGCKACVDLARAAQVMGLKCLRCNPGTRTLSLDASYAPSPVVYTCEKCGNSDFQEQLNILDSLETVSTTDDLLALYGKLKKICWKESYYFQECGERLVQAYLDMLGEQYNDQQLQREYASRALRVLEELLSPDFSSLSGHFFRGLIQKYKAAKLRVFLTSGAITRPDISDLEEVKTWLSVYYPAEHELMVGLKKCICDAIC
eukprot:scaffold2605_cov136-Cylindrotheca_fusiformis.AAC.2